MRFLRASIAIAACALASCLAAGVCAQSENVSPPPDIDSDRVSLALEEVPDDLKQAFSQALADLAADDWQKREIAETWLENSPVADSVFEALLNAGPLAPERQHRLVAVLRDRILQQERGAMGIEMTTGASPVQVIEVRPNMAAQGRLQVGDTIIAIDGFSIVTSLDLEAVLRDRRPGQQIEVTVRRKAQNQEDPALPIEETVLTIPLKLTDDSLFSEDEQIIRRQDRVLRAREVVARHAPRPEPARLQPGAAVDSGEASEIEALRRQIAQYDGAADETTRRMLEAQWRAMRDALLNATVESGISESERLRRWELYNAFADLLPPRID